MHRSILPIVTLVLAASARAAISIGGLAIVGYQDNGTPDNFSFVALENIAAGEVIYFTDNGWTGSAYRTASATDGDGNESLIKFATNNPILAGRVISSVGAGADFTWTITGLVPGGTIGSFNNLSLSTSGDQIYAFQGPLSLPLQNVTNHIYVLDTTVGFELATDNATGAITPGLSTAAYTAVTGFTPGGTFGLNPAASAVAALQSSGGTGAQWLQVIADPTNWVSGSQPAGPLNVIAVPEPSSTVLLLAALGLVAARRRARR